MEKVVGKSWEIIVIYYHFNIPTVGPFRCADTHMTTGDVVYSLRFSHIKILPEPGFDLGLTAGESSVLIARLHMLYTLHRIYNFLAH